ncbi:MAG: hypothetical protein CM15mP74_02290 [Halieaceae bacterium]|nr:MAG: hypothetical protein CM15mP74_02290 [Halieaceae bacterium]
MVGLLESVTSWTKEKLNVSRQRSTILVVGSVTTLSVVSVLSYNIWADYQLLGMNFNELTEACTTNSFYPWRVCSSRYLRGGSCTVTPVRMSCGMTRSGSAFGEV